jgi:demethylmacrocin O-methyltransferase
MSAILEKRLRQTATAILPADVKTQIKRQEFALRARRTSDLDALALHFGTDKSSGGHGYTRLYQHHFASHRKRIRSVLEIGVGGTTSVDGYETTEGGQSLRMWSRYFPNAQIVGIDIYEKNVAGERIHFAQGSQSDPEFLARLASQYGPFDVVIDDGSHVGRDIIASFKGLYDHVRPGGFYVIEDMAVAYHPDWEGGPPGTPGTGVELVKQLLDRVLRRYHDDAFQPDIGAIHAYGEIVFIERPAK